jgi:hypothetical protein
MLIIAAMRITSLVVVFLLTAPALFAAPVITSITPATAPVEGGTTVIIRGTGFSNNCIICSPPFADPFVFFGGTESPKVRFVDPTMLEVVTPPHLPGRVPVTVRPLDGSDPFTLPNAFEFEGVPEDGFEPILFPIFLPPIPGAFNSIFETIPRVGSRGPDRIHLYGEDFRCLQAAPTRMDSFDPVILDPNHADRTLEVDCSTSTGRIFWVRKGTERSLVANLRVSDRTRRSLSHGTEIRVVRRSDFTTDKIVLLGVPYDLRFRITLRIYALEETSSPVYVEIGGAGQQVFLQPGSSIFEPSVATISDFSYREQINPTLSPDRVVVQSFDVPVYAFISVTNNETQQITTITP